MDLFEKVVNIKEIKNKKELKENEQSKLFELVEEIEPKNFKEMADFFNNKLSSVQNEVKDQVNQNKRLANSIEALLPEIKKVKVDDETAAIKFSTDPFEKDIACYDLKAPSEAKYPLSTSKVAIKLGISSPSQVGKMMKELKIKGDYLFHYEFETGNKSKIQRYSHAVMPEIFNRLNNPAKYEIDNTIAIFWRQRIKNIPTKKG